MLLLLGAVDAGLAGCFFGVPGERWAALRAAFGVPDRLRTGRRGQPRLPGRRTSARRRCGAAAASVARGASAYGVRRSWPSRRVRAGSTRSAYSAPPPRRVASCGAITRDDALQVVDRGELDGDLALAPAEVDPDPGVEARRTACRPARPTAGAVIRWRGARRRGLLARRARCWCSATSSSVARTDRPSATIRPASSSCASASSSAEQRPGVPGGQHAGGDPALHRHRQVQQPDGVADLRAAAADPVRPARRGWRRTPRAAAGRRQPPRAG